MNSVSAIRPDVEVPSGSSVYHSGMDDVRAIEREMLAGALDWFVERAVEVSRLMNAGSELGEYFDSARRELASMAPLYGVEPPAFGPRPLG